MEYLRPDKLKEVISGQMSICNGNSYYTLYRGIPEDKLKILQDEIPNKIKELGGVEAKKWLNDEKQKIPEEDIVKEIRYTNLPVEMLSYCSWVIDNRLNEFLIPKELDDPSKYKVDSRTSNINGKNAIAIKVEFLNQQTKDSKSKSGIQAGEPHSSVVIFYVDASDYSMTKIVGYLDGKVAVERNYKEFRFNPQIDNKDFIISQNNIQTETLDLSEKLS